MTQNNNGGNVVMDDDEDECPPNLGIRGCHTAAHGEDCPICLDSMCKSDSMHPLQCSSPQCEFNMCASCIESLLTSSNDDFQIASDGNRHVKVYLHCPNCRSDLGPSIRETLLLRKADYVLLLASMADTTTTTTKGGVDVEEMHLTPSQERLKKVLDEGDEEVLEAIGKARDRETAFFLSKVRAADAVADKNGDGDNDAYDYDDGSDEDWGVEADLSTGVHDSFHVPKHLAAIASGVVRDALAFADSAELNRRSHEVGNKDSNDDDDEEGKLDATLILGGYESALDVETRRKVMRLLVSGDANGLSEAAEIIRACIQKASLPFSSSSSSSSSPSQSFLIRRKLRSSVYELIDEAEMAREAESTKENNGSGGCGVNHSTGTNGATKTPPFPTSSGEGGRKSAAMNRSRATGAVTGARKVDAKAKRSAFRRDDDVYSLRDETRRNIAQERREASVRAARLKSFPLPVRMPKCVELPVSTTSPPPPPPPSPFGRRRVAVLAKGEYSITDDLSFVDDEWDGSVADAYSKLTVRGGGIIGGEQLIFGRARGEGIGKGAKLGTMKPAFRVDKTAIPRSYLRGVTNVLSEGRDPDDTSRLGDRIDVPQRRVLVAAVRGNCAGKAGVMRGDVVTHVNGKEWTGTVAELVEELKAFEKEVVGGDEEGKGDQQKKVSLVLNAERCVAEALRRRARASALFAGPCVGR